MPRSEENAPSSSTTRQANKPYSRNGTHSNSNQPSAGTSAKRSVGRPRKRQPLAASTAENNTSVSDKDAEINALKAQVAEETRLRKAAEEASQAQVEEQTRLREAAEERADAAAREYEGRVTRNENQASIVPIGKPKGEAGNKKKGFILRDAMQLDGEENKELFHTIQRSVRRFAVQACIDFSSDYRNIDPEKLAKVFKMTRTAHPYMTKQRFPCDWAAAEILKQYLKNYRRYEVKLGRMEKRSTRRVHDTSSEPENRDNDEDREGDEEDRENSIPNDE